MIDRIAITDRKSWLNLRQQDVTASDVAVVCGCSPFKTALGLWAEKTGAVAHGGETEIMRRGRHLEDAVINYFRDDFPGVAIDKPGIYLRDPVSRIGATPDAIAAMPEGEVVVQCKVVARPVFEREWDDGPPLHYQLQVLTEAMLWEAPRGVLAVLAIDAFGAAFHTFDVPRHAGAEQRIRTAVQNFWEDVAAGQQPRADYARDADLLQALYAPKDLVPPKDFGSDNRLPEILAEYGALKAEIDLRETRRKEIKAEIVDKLGGATLGVLPGWKISHTIQHRKSYEVKATSFPVLKITPTKESAP